MGYFIIPFLITIIFWSFFFKHFSNKPVEIKCRVYFVDWFKAFGIILFIFVLMFFIDFVFVLNIDKLFSDVGFYRVVKKLFENGIIVPMSLFIISFAVNKTIKENNIDKLEYYTPEFNKISISIIIFAVCIKLLGVFNEVDDDVFTDYCYSRIVMWLVAVIGIWIGYHEDGKKINTLKKKMALKYCIALVSFLFILLIPFSFFDTIYFFYLMVGIILPSIFFLMIYIIYYKIYRNPSKSRSLRILDKTIEENKQGIFLEKRFGIMTYCVKNNKVFINAIPIIYSGHEKELIKLFGEKELTFKNVDDLKEKLTSLYEKQTTYLKNEYDKCYGIRKNRKRK